MSLKSKDLVGIKGLDAADIELILETASGFKDVLGRDIKKVPALRGKTTVNLFYEPSTRTRTSFELAAKRLIYIALVPERAAPLSQPMVSSNS